MSPARARNRIWLQRVEQERPFERHAAARAHCGELADLVGRHAAGLVEQPADQGRLAVVDVPDDDDAHERAHARRLARNGSDMIGMNVHGWTRSYGGRGYK